MNKFLLLITSLIVLSAGYIVYRTLMVSEIPLHYHANFAVYINNRQVNFSDPSYMHLAPCLADTSVISFNKLDNVHLHDLVGNVVHVHQGGVVWNDLFKSIKYDLFKDVASNNNPPVSYYLNGKKVDKSILSRPINKEDKLLISADAQPAPSVVTDSELYKKQYESAGDTAKEYDNGSKGAEKCGSVGKRSFLTRLKIALKTLNSDINI
jgi:hypothetical protein